MKQLELLRSISRSFYVSIRVLPRSLREPVALAYLLARATDTVADSTGVDVDLRIAMLDALAGAIQGEAGTVADQLRKEFAPQQKHASEKKLIGSVEVCLNDLQAMPTQDRAEIRATLVTITRGQRLDLLRWREGGAALAKADDLREYTYLVAGCVGEFWTRLCFRKVERFAYRPESELLDLGKRYGAGLQLVNILRDAGDDLRAGRCYFPQEELRAAGLTLADMSNAPAAFLPIYQRWITEARTGLDAGLEYSIAVNAPRVRIATVLPALIGVRTLSLLEERGLEALRERVKVPRAEVREMIASAAITLASRSKLRSLRANL